MADRVPEQPVLLFGFGIAILVFAAGALAIESLRVVAGSLLALVIVMMVVWVVLKALELKTAQSANTVHLGDTGGDVDISRSVNVESSRIHGGVWALC